MSPSPCPHVVQGLGDYDDDLVKTEAMALRYTLGGIQVGQPPASEKGKKGKTVPGQSLR